ncbi:MAG TPA: 2-hydroxychromene-2-carboxylate isomerase [Candidatus Cybelea sp.]|nr:2-hydroxychromene-2-carboxylate isomerase [Candidatus Cybelea sp.]
MTKSLEFYFDYGSPYSYVAYVRLPEVIKRTGAKLIYRPMLLGGVFQATGNSSPAFNKLKWPNSQRDLVRYVSKYKIPFQRNPHFPINTLKLMRGAVATEIDGTFDRYTAAIFPAMWRDALNMGEDAVFAEVLTKAGLDAAHVFKRIGEDDVKNALKANTEAAVARGVFGAPTFFVDGEMFFGQDRLEFVEDALTGRSWIAGAAG